MRGFLLSVPSLDVLVGVGLELVSGCAVPGLEARKRSSSGVSRWGAGL